MNKPQIEFNNEGEHQIRDEVLKQIAVMVWNGEKISDQYEISVLFCESDKMREFNRLYRGKDSVTDVLSFAHEALPGLDGSDTKLILCDIIIDTNYIFNQKGSDGFDKEMEEVFIHSLLHLLGYDHIKTKDREIMEDKEKSYITKLRGVTQSGRW
ncbi:MAG TPA: rRNA maturation RNase YbeY [Candidatus Cloacimonadota bacterium]|nr:rRNA maturation RNase YbeY [Candidatus Cloacimonadota bacterium]HPS38327.1 rRNA maturation RNase YbeY [Candidatus Cloacimonadota bacterium]